MLRLIGGEHQLNLLLKFRDADGVTLVKQAITKDRLEVGTSTILNYLISLYLYI